MISAAHGWPQYIIWNLHMFHPIPDIFVFAVFQVVQDQNILCFR